MSQPPQTGTRLVNRGEYAKAQSKQVSLRDVILRWAMSVSICLIIWAILSPLFYEQFFEIAKRTGDFTGWLFWLICFLFPLLLVSVSTTRKVIVKTREQYFPSVPANTADLPMSDSLVRASSEPIQEQEAVLLRAAVEDADKHEEQLVRAVNGQA